MLKRLLIIFGLVLFSSYAWAQHSGNAPGTSVQEEDGSPDASCFVLKVGNGDLTDNGDGTCSITTGGGGTPGGSDGDIQFNDSSSFGGFGDWNGVQLSVTGSLSITGTASISSDFSIEGIDNAGTWYYDTSTNTQTVSGTVVSTAGFVANDGTDSTQTILCADRASTDACITWDEIDDEWEFNFPINTGGSGNRLAFGNGEFIENTVDGSLSFQGGSGADDVNMWFDLDGTMGFIASTDGTIGVFEENITIGKFADNDIDVCIHNGDSPEPCLRYQAAGSKWQFSNDGSSYSDMGSGGSSTDCVTFRPNQFSISGTIALTGDATQGATPDGSNGGVLLFDETTDEGAGIVFIIPSGWTAHNGIHITYSMESATTLDVEWEAAVMCQSPGDAERDDADSFAAFAVATETIPGTTLNPSAVTITVTDDSCAANDRMLINISTDSDDATNDDATGDRRLLGVRYCYDT